MISFRLPPTFMPGIPWSQPGTTCPTPIWSVYAPRPAWRLESKGGPPVDSHPVYWTVMFIPLLATSPVPTVRSTYLSPSGYVVTGSPAPSLKLSVPGDGLTRATAGPGLSLATGPVPAYGSGYPHAVNASAARGMVARYSRPFRGPLTRR